MPKGHPLNFTAAQIAEIRQLYESGLLVKDIAAHFGLSFTGIRVAMVKNGIARREAARKYSIDHHSFDDLANEQAAYWLGFLYADACWANPTALQLILSGKDADHLQRFAAFLKSDTPVTVQSYRKTGYDKEYQRAVLVVSSIHMSTMLHSYGLVVRRTEPQRLLDSIPPQSFRHWLRGFFDGDGSASKCKQIWYCGDYPILAHIRRLLAQEAGRNPAINLYEHRSGIYYLHYKGYYNAHAVADYMYQDATIWMPRKRAVIDGWKEPMPRSERGRLRWGGKK